MTAKVIPQLPDGLVGHCAFNNCSLVIAAALAAVGCLLAIPANAPAAKSKESPGRKGVSTRPVSQNTIVHRMA